MPASAYLAHPAHESLSTGSLMTPLEMPCASPLFSKNSHSAIVHGRTSTRHR